MSSWLMPAIEILVLGGGAAFLLWQSYRLRKKLEEARKKSELEQQERERQEQAKQEQVRRAQRQLREKKIGEILAAGDSRITKRLLKQAGIGSPPAHSAAQDQNLIKQIAKQLSEIDIEVLHIAATQKDINFNLQKNAVRVASHYPTGNIEPERMNDFNQLPAVLPEQLLLDDQTYYDNLAAGELMVLQSYETTVDQKLLYILLDASGSMDYAMENGFPRHVWARGVTVNLLLKAVDGEAKYFFRPFTDNPLGLCKALTKSEAENLMNVILNTKFNQGGTCIFAAFAQAINDIRTLGGEISKAEILVITDGEDKSMDDADKIKKLMGDDIRLHVAMIGLESESLKRVAASYRVFK